MTALHLYEPEKVPVNVVWPFVSGLATSIANTSRGKVRPDDIRTYVEQGKMQLWLVLDENGAALALVVTEIQDFPATKICIVHGLAGTDRGKWMHHLQGIEAWARGLGCSRMEVRGRKGMARVLPEYKLTAVYLEKDLH